MNAGRNDPRTVLLVEHEQVPRDEFATWLEDAGFVVISCPGPSSPDYTCIGGRGLPCPLAKAADVVVLDLHQASDLLLRGTPGWQLLLYYYENGASVVALVDEEDPVRPTPEDGVSLIRKPVQRDEMIEDVRRMLTRTSLPAR